jgi:hypothetical protein
VRELLDRLDEAAVMGREVRGVDRAGRDPGDVGNAQVGEEPRGRPQEADVVGGARASAGEGDAEVVRARPPVGIG